jgi:hypothetical protein
MNVIECLLWAAVAGFELTISSGAVLLLTRQACPGFFGVDLAQSRLRIMAKQAALEPELG